MKYNKTLNYFKKIKIMLEGSIIPLIHFYNKNSRFNLMRIMEVLLNLTKKLLNYKIMIRNQFK